MKPNFILELSQDGVRLRAADGDNNTVLGSVSLSEPDFDEKVAALRNAIAEKSDTPLATELRIPDSEILYTTLDDPEFDPRTAKGSRDDLRDAAVRDALEGMTPYSLIDLNFIWKIKGKGELAIAAVAHGTLAEAEQFAASRGFNPVRFAARPGENKFKGLADFGPTAVQRARAIAEADARIAAEIAAKAEAEAKPAPQPEPAKDAAPSDKAAPLPPESTQGDSSAAPGKTSAVGDTPAIKPEPARAGPEAAAPSAALPTPPPASPAPPTRRLNIAPANPDAANPDTSKPEPAKPEAAKPGVADAAASRAPQTVEGRDAPRVGFSQPRVNDPLPPIDESAVVDDVPPMPALSFASRRKPGTAPTLPTPNRIGALTPGAAADGDAKDSRLSRIAARFAVSPGADSLAKAAVPPPPPRRSPVGATPLAKTGANTVLRGSSDRPGMPGPRPVRAPIAGGLPDTTAAVASLTPRVEATGRPPDDPARVARTSAQNEAEAMTVFGARAASSNRSFMPLVIGIALAAALAVAVWAAFLLMGDGEVTGDTGALLPEAETALEPAPAPQADAPVPEVEVAALPPTETPPAEVPQPSADTTTVALQGTDETGIAEAGTLGVPDSTVATLGPVAPVAPASEALPLNEAAPPPLSNDLLQRPPAGDANSDNVVARYATTGVWVEPPSATDAPPSDRIDNLYIASIDPAIALPAAAPVAPLAAARAPDSVLPQLPPTAPGQVFDLDDNGLVRATPEGAVSPQGILITAGAPPSTPPTRPDRPESLTPTAETQPDLPRTRPRDRPEDAAVENEETQAASPAPETRLAALQPQPRPDGIAPEIDTAANAARTAAAGASAALPSITPAPRPANLAALLPQPDPEPVPEAEPVEVATAPISPYAVDRSRLPRARPGDFERTAAQVLARARTPAAPAAQPEREVTRVAAPAAVTTPSIPSRASVAAQATVKNAINLGRINLLGVYGTASNRSALVRLPSGRLVTVKVGDRVDGGRVAAIGQSQLNYTKGGRQLVLAMPNG